MGVPVPDQAPAAATWACVLPMMSLWTTVSPVVVAAGPVGVPVPEKVPAARDLCLSVADDAVVNDPFIRHRSRRQEGAYARPNTSGTDLRHGLTNNIVVHDCLTSGRHRRSRGSTRAGKSPRGGHLSLGLAKNAVVNDHFIRGGVSE